MANFIYFTQDYFKKREFMIASSAKNYFEYICWFSKELF